MIFLQQSYKIILLTVPTIVLWTLLGSSLYGQNESVEWHSFEVAIKSAHVKSKPILVDVWAPWCGWCKKMQRDIYPVISENIAQEFIWTRLNRGDNETSLQFKNQIFTPLRLAQRLNVQNVPAIVFLSAEGDYIFHLSGFQDAETLEPLMHYVASYAYQRESFENFLTKQDNQ